MDGSKQRHTTVQRAILVLRTLADTPQPMGITEVAATLELPKASVFRLLRDLREVDCVMYDDRSQTYTLGPTLVQLGEQARGQLHLMNTARPVLEQLTKKVGEMVNIGILYDNKVLILDSVRDIEGPCLTVNLAPVSELHCSAIGKALLSCLPPDLVEEMVRSLDLSQRTPNTITSRDVLCQEIEEIRQTGIAYDQEEYEMGLFCLGVPVCNGEHPLAAISIAGPVSRMKAYGLESMETALLDAAQHLELLLKSAGHGAIKVF